MSILVKDVLDRVVVQIRCVGLLLLNFLTTASKWAS